MIAEPNIKRIKILITEDSSFIAGLYRAKFETEGFEATIAADGNAAILQLKRIRPDIVLLDMILPDMNGVDVLRFIRSEESLRDLPVIVLSGSSTPDLVQAAREAGANRFLSKTSSTPKQVVDEVRRALAADQTPELPVRRSGEAGPVVEKAGDALADLRKTERDHASRVFAALRPLAQSVARCEQATAGPLLLEIHRQVRSLNGHSIPAGLSSVGQMSRALETLLGDLCANPKKVNLSSLRTVAQAINFIGVLMDQDESRRDLVVASPLILVLDDEFISRDAICTALEKTNLRAIGLDDPRVALDVLEENRFDLIFLDVDMPRMNGFEVCQKLRATSANAATPVVFVTSLTDFESRSISASSGGTDFIAKPIVLLELAVKATMHLLRGRLARAVAA